MKRYVIFLFILLFFVQLFSYDFVSNPFEFNTIITNPAALSYFDNVSFTYQRYWVNNQKFNFNDEKQIYLNLKGIGYALSSSNNSYHTLAFSQEVFNNFYFADSYYWKNNKVKNGEYNLGFLYRPFGFISFGGKFSDLFDRKNHKADVGVSFRPFFSEKRLFINWLDIDFASSYFQGDFAKPVVGLKLELINGVNIKGDYNFENEKISLGFSLNFGHLQFGTLSNDIQNNDKGMNFVKISTKKEMGISNLLTTFLPVYCDYKLEGKLIETKPEGLNLGFIKLSMGKYVTISQIKDRLKELEKENIKGIIFRNPRIKFNLSAIEELKPYFNHFRATGKKVIFYFDHISGNDYIAAATFGDKIYLNPQGELILPQLGVKAPYLKDLLEKLGISVQNFRSHKYKTAGNMFSESQMTEAEKETYKALLKDLSIVIKKLIIENRGNKFSNNYQDLVNKQPFYTAKEALSCGLIDGITYQVDLKDKIEKNNKKVIFAKFIGEKMKNNWSKKAKSKVALIYAVGNIHTGKNRYGKSIGSETLTNAIRKARKNKSIKGIIIRVDSGGGSALASDIIAHEVELARKKNKKPVVISMGRVAASGGYYISALSDKIVAQPSTITGSIGVIGMVPEFSKLYRKIGINWSSLKINKYAGYPPTERPMTDEEKSFIKKSIDEIYWEFISVVAKGRHKNKNEIHKIAQGRVWSGLSAYKLGLVDRLGGLDTAKEEIKKLANIKNDIELVEFKGNCKKPFGNFDYGSNLILQVMPKELKDTYYLFKKFSLLKNEPVMLILPMEVELK